MRVSLIGWVKPEHSLARERRLWTAQVFRHDATPRRISLQGGRETVLWKGGFSGRRSCARPRRQARVNLERFEQRELIAPDADSAIRRTRGRSPRAAREPGR